MNLTFFLEDKLESAWKVIPLGGPQPLLTIERYENLCPPLCTGITGRHILSPWAPCRIWLRLPSVRFYLCSAYSPDLSYFPLSPVGLSQPVTHTVHEQILLVLPQRKAKPHTLLPPTAPTGPGMATSPGWDSAPPWSPCFSSCQQSHFHKTDRVPNNKHIRYVPHMLETFPGSC